MGIRIVVCLDFDVETPEEAYAKLNLAALSLSAAKIEWESTDEWYDDDDDDGEPLSQERIDAARDAYYATLPGA